MAAEPAARLIPGLGLGGRNSEEFKVWRLAQRRVFNRGDQSSDSAPNDPDGETLTINTSALGECLGTFDNLAVDNLAVVNLYGKRATPVGSALDGSMLCSALDGLGGSTLSSAHDRSTLGSTLSSAHDRSTLGSALDAVSSSALSFALDGSSLGSTPVGSALDGSMLCSAHDGLGGSMPVRLALDGSMLSSAHDRSTRALNTQRAGPSNGARPSQSSSNRPPFQHKAGSKDGYKGQSKGAGLNDKNRFGLCSFCDARGCQNADNPKAGIDTCSVFGGCPCKPNASPDEAQFVELQRKFLKEAGPKSKYHSPPYLKGTASRSNIWQFTKDLAERSMATNLPISSSSVRMGREPHSASRQIPHYGRSTHRRRGHRERSLPLQVCGSIRAGRLRR